MNVQETTEIRALTADELDQPAGGFAAVGGPLWVIYDAAIDYMIDMMAVTDWD